MVFVDFSKAFDTDTGMMANVSVGGEVLESFSVTNGGQARLCTGPHALLHLPISNTR